MSALCYPPQVALELGLMPEKKAQNEFGGGLILNGPMEDTSAGR